MGGKWKKYSGGKPPGSAPQANANDTQPQAPVAMDVDEKAAVAQPVQQQPVAKPQNQTAAVAKPQPTATRKRATLSIAVPGSVIEKAATADVAAATAAQIARAAAIFCVDEVVVYDDSGSSGNDGVSIATATLARLLQYLETPSHIRAALYPNSVAYPELRSAEAVSPTLNTPHHQRGTEWNKYREGVVMRSETGLGSFVDIGYDRNAHVQEDLPTSRRVTLCLGDSPVVEFVPAFSETMLKAKIADPSEPQQQSGCYWGYSVRVAKSISRAVKECGYSKAGYDLVIGTSREGVEREVAELVLPQYKHALVVFGGVQGLEQIVEADEAYAQAGKSASDVCGMYLNCCPGQGVVEIKTEDAVPMCMAYLHASLSKFGSR